MYGTIFTPQRRPINGDEYLRLLETHKPRIDWDTEGEEAVIECTTEERQDAEVWYPTLYSIRYVRHLNQVAWIDFIDRKRLDLIDDFDVGGISFWELGQVVSPFPRCMRLISKGLDYFYELI